MSLFAQVSHSFSFTLFSYLLCRLGHPHRAIFQIKNDDANPTSSATIVLNYVEEVIKWAQFVGHDLRTMEFKDLTDTVHHRELLFVLGADLDDTSMASIRFAPGVQDMSLCAFKLLPLPGACHSCIHRIRIKTTQPSIPHSLASGLFF